MLYTWENVQQIIRLFVKRMHAAHIKNCNTVLEILVTIIFRLKTEKLKSLKINYPLTF